MTRRAPHRSAPAANDNRPSVLGTILVVVLSMIPMAALALMLFVPMTPLFWGVR